MSAPRCLGILLIVAAAVFVSGCPDHVAVSISAAPVLPVWILRGPSLQLRSRWLLWPGMVLGWSVYWCGPFFPWARSLLRACRS